MHAPELSVVVPAYNEAAGIAATVGVAARRRSKRQGLSHEVLVVDNASADGTAGGGRGARRRARARAAQPAQPRQGRLDAARHARGRAARCGCTATRTAAPSLPALGRACSSWIERRRRGRRLAARRGRRRRPPAAACAGASRAAPSWPVPARAPRADARPVLRLQALARRGRRGRLPRARALDGWVFDAETLAMARALGLPDRRGRDPVGGPGGLAALDAARDRARDARAARRRAGASRAIAAAPAAPGCRARQVAPTAGRDAARRLDRCRGGACWRRWPRWRSRCSPGCCCKVWLRGGVVTGADGFLVADPMQYLDWARQAGEHVADRQPARPRADGAARVPAPGAAALGLL